MAHERHAIQRLLWDVMSTDHPEPARSFGAVADAYDAMTSNRAYRSALPHEVAVNELEHCAGKQFDPDVVGSFAEKIDELRQAFRDAKLAVPE